MRVRVCSSHAQRSTCVGALLNILIVSTYYILYISWIIKCLIIIDARCKHEDHGNSSQVTFVHLRQEGRLVRFSQHCWYRIESCGFLCIVDCLTATVYLSTRERRFQTSTISLYWKHCSAFLKSPFLHFQRNLLYEVSMLLDAKVRSVSCVRDKRPEHDINIPTFSHTNTGKCPSCKVKV